MRVSTDRLIKSRLALRPMSDESVAASKDGQPWRSIVWLLHFL